MCRHEDLVWTPRTHIKSRHGYACLQPQLCGRWKWEAWGLSAVLQQGSADLSQRMTVDSNGARQMSSFSYADAQRHAFTHTYTEKQLFFVNEILDGFYVTHCLDLEMSSKRCANMFKSKVTNNLA